MSFLRYASEPEEGSMEEVANYRSPVSEKSTITSPAQSCSPIDTVTCQEKPWEARYPFDYLIPAPSAVLPKSLALAYRNYHLWYHKIDYHDGERKLAGSDLVSKILRFYFPATDFEFKRIPKDGNMLPNVIIDTVAVLGTIYWVVVVRQGKQKYGLDRSNADLALPDGSRMPNHIAENRPTAPPGSVVLLVAVATDKAFGTRPERQVPSILKFSGETIASSGTIKVGQYSFQKGHVVVLGSKEDRSRVPPPQPDLSNNKKKNIRKQGGPLPSAAAPVWEFYTFEAKGNVSRSVFPWFGQTASYPRGFSKNGFSLETNDLGAVDEMFKRLVGCSYGGDVIPGCRDT